MQMQKEIEVLKVRHNKKPAQPMAEKPLSSMTKDELIDRLVSFFDKPDQARTLIMKHLKGKEMVDDAGRSNSLVSFVMANEELYKRRIKHKTEHPMSVLENQLVGKEAMTDLQLVIALNGRVQKIADLDVQELAPTDDEKVFRQDNCPIGVQNRSRVV